jgi:hypothetical protein
MKRKNGGLILVITMVGVSCQQPKEQVFTKPSNFVIVEPKAGAVIQSDDPVNCRIEISNQPDSVRPSIIQVYLMQGKMNLQTALAKQDSENPNVYVGMLPPPARKGKLRLEAQGIWYVRSQQDVEEDKPARKFEEFTSIDLNSVHREKERAK